MSLAINKPKYLASALTRLFAFEKASIANSLTDNINIFLTVDQSTISEHFNQNDPAPLYKRQLSHQFQQYIMTSVEAAKRYSVFYYKTNCKTAMDKQYVDAFVYAIRRHFSNKKLIAVARFEKFKKRSYLLLFASLTVVMICHGIVPMILSEDVGFSSALRNGLDIFSWVILWQPIDKLVFYWNPHLKDISIMDRLSKAEIIISENA